MTSGDAFPRILCLGELLVDMVPTLGGGGLREADTYVRAAGGAPANAAVAATRLGAAAGMAAAVGADPFGRWLRSVLDASGVDTRFVRQVESQTAVAFVALDRHGERDFMFYGDHPAHYEVTAEHALAAATALAEGGGTRVLHFGSVCLAREPARSATAAAVHQAAAAGCLVSVDVNLRESFWGDLDEARDVIWGFVGKADIVKLSAGEAAFLEGTSVHAGARVAERLLADRERLVVVSLGADGAEAYTPVGLVTAPSPRVRAVDATGAGDALCGAVLAATVADPEVWLDPARSGAALTRACAYAALSTTRHGGIPSYASVAELAAFESSFRGTGGGQPR